MGLFATIAERFSAKIHLLYLLEEQGYRSFQDCGSGRISKTLGHSEKPLVDELRQDVKSAQILLQSQYFAQGPRREALLPVSFTFLSLSVLFHSDFRR